MRAARGEGLIQIQRPLSVPGMTENRVVKQDLVHDVCAGTPLVIAVLLHLKLVVTPKRYAGSGFQFPRWSYCMACYERRVQRSSYSLPSLLMHFGFITLPIPPGLDFKIRESPPFKDTHVRVVYKIYLSAIIWKTIDQPL